VTRVGPVAGTDVFSSSSPGAGTFKNQNFRTGAGTV